MSTGPERASAAFRGARARRMLLSFERPARTRVVPDLGVRTFARTALENRTVATQPRTDSSRGCISIRRTQRADTQLDPDAGYHRPALLSVGRSEDHRQDSKGTWWMPWHLESMKGVDDCEKPRLGVEQPLTRGFPNGETQRW